MFGIDDMIGSLIGFGMNQFGREESQDFASAQQASQQGYNEAMQGKQHAFTSWQADIDRTFNYNQAALNRHYDREMQNTAIQRRMQDLSAAGVNPLLAVQPGAGAGTGSPSGASHSTPSVGMASSGIASPTPFPTQAAFGTASQIARVQAETAALNAETAKREAEKDEIVARTPTHGVNIDRMRQEIQESQARIVNIFQQVETGHATATNIAQQTQNLQAELPRIQATVKQLGTLASLNEAQRVETLTRSGVNIQEAKKLSQHIAAGLPALEAAVKELERQVLSAAMPGHEQQRAVDESYVGTLGRVIRSLSPFTGFFGGINIRGTGAPTPATPDRKFPRSR